MNKDNIIITKIENNLIRTGQEGLKYNLTCITAYFEYKNMSGNIKIPTNKTLNEEDIKDKIIEIMRG
jgi:hypothetical protein